jgi:hypothetical protein
MPPINSNETYCTFTLASDVTAGGLPSEAEIAKDLESNDPNVSLSCVGCVCCRRVDRTDVSGRIAT